MIESLSLELKFGSEKYTKIKKAVMDDFKASQLKMQKRYKAWEEAEDLYISYLKESEDDAKRRTARTSKGTQTFTTITIPYSYATLLTAHTYWASVFLSRTPVNQYTGRHGESQQSIQALEALIDYQVSVGGILPAYYLWLLDAGKYGVGIVGNYWAEEETSYSRIVEQPVTFLGIPVPGKTKREMVTERIRGYSGNKVYNVRPFDFFPDPNVSLANFQEGDFCGRLSYPSWTTIKALAAQGKYFNVEAAEKAEPASFKSEGGSSNIDRPGGDETEFASFGYGRRGTKTQPVLLELVKNIIPAEWGVGQSTDVEKWVFSIAQNEVLIGARPQGNLHDKFPFAVMSYEVAGYAHAERGMLEVLKPLNYTLDWLLNSHFFNVRKILNDNFIVDPQRVEMKDLRDDGPGRLIRLKPAAYGTDVRSVISQLQVMDVTQTHLRDVQLIIEIIQRVTGVTDNIMGLPKPGGRRTATETRTSTSFGVNRLKTFSEYNSALGFGPLSQMMVQNTQQLYDLEQMYKIAGDLLPGAPKFMKVTPEDIRGFYDFVHVDGTLPIDRYAQANLWKEILMGIVQVPQIAMQYDIAGIFSWMAQVAGLKNITQFKLQLAPDAQVAAQAQAGNLIPAGKVNGTGQAPEIAGALQ